MNLLLDKITQTPYDRIIMKKVSALIVVGASYLTFIKPAFAQTINTCPESPFNVLCGITFGENLFSTLITVAFVLASLLALAFLVYGGVKWITSGGDKAGVESARNIIVAALVGLVITFLAYFIINIVMGFFGLSISELNMPSITDGV